MSIVGSNILAGASGQVTAAADTKSLRFNSTDSAYLSRTPSSAGNRRTWTWSGWVKLGVLGTTRDIFTSRTTAGDYSLFYLTSGNQLRWQDSAAGSDLLSTQVFRDPSAWYHLLIAVDTTQATAADRTKIYVNGAQITTFSTETYPTQNNDTNINRTVSTDIGRAQYNGEYFDGYLADVHFIDGQALSPSDFAEADATTGQWVPKAYSGSYGTNGFHLLFNNTADLGEDSAGSNDWTVNNISVFSTYSGDVTDTASPSGSSMIIKAVGSTVTGTFNAAGGTTGNINYYTSSDGNSWSFQETSSGESSSFTAKYISMGGGGNNVRQFTSTSGSYQYSVAGSTSLDNNVSTVTVDQTGLFADSSDHDSLFDSPSTGTQSDTGLGGEVSGNYCVLNPLHKYGSLSFSNGNLEVSASADTFWVLGTLGVSSGKWYWEGELTSGSAVHFGISESSYSGTTSRPHQTTSGYTYLSDGRTYHNASVATYGASYTTGDIIGVALDMDAGNLVFYKNGTSQGTAFTGLSGTFTPCFSDTGSTGGAIHNFGQRPWEYSAPSGYKALCLTNTSDPTITDPSDYMDVALYTGNQSARSITGLNFSPDLVWIKKRSASGGHPVFDTVRGVTKYIQTHSTGAEGTDTDALTAFNSDGFSLGTGYTTVDVNQNTATYVAWTWDAGSSTVSNTDGSITSSVRANASAGFSIVSHTGTGSAATVGHGLGAEPYLIIHKNRDTVVDWVVYHKDVGNSNGLKLNSASGPFATDMWNYTSPTSTVFTAGPTTANNESTKNIISYCWAPVEGYSAFGSYTGNGSTDGPFVHTGFRPRWIMLKRTDTTADWYIFDAARNTYNALTSALFPNDSASEATNSVYAQDFASNGWKIRSSQTQFNANGGTYIWASFAESPFKYANAR